MARGAFAALLLAGGLACSAPLSAQSSVLAGMVTDSAGGAVARARVSVDAEYFTATDSAGRFRLDSLAPGPHRLRVGRLGFIARVTEIVLADSARVTVRLDPDPRPLAEIRATAQRRRRISPRMQEFELRRTQHIGSGRFLTRADLEAARPLRLADVLRRLPGTQIVSDRAALGHYLTSPRSVGPHALQHAPGRCYAQIFVDGSQYYAGDGRSGPQDLDEFPLDDLQAVEYYANPSSTPAQFRTMNSDCGTLVLWTREADAPEPPRRSAP
jgi:hypothetical protein